MMRIADEMQERSLSFEVALQDLASVAASDRARADGAGRGAGDDPDRERLQALAARFAAEDLQLDYQIALQGRADLRSRPTSMPASP